MPHYLKRYLPLFILGIGVLVVWLTGLHDALSFDVLRENRHFLLDFVERSFWLAAFMFVLIYVGVVALSIPGATILTVTGGFLFGTLLGTVLVVISATTGATLLFLIAKTSLGNALRKKAGPWLQKMEKGFQDNALSYLLVLRLVPLFPFFIVNLVPAFLGVSGRIFVLATLVGIIPGSFVYVSVGTGLGSLFDQGETLSLKGVLTPEILLALSGLACLSLLPVVYKRFKADDDKTPK